MFYPCENIDRQLTVETPRGAKPRFLKPLLYNPAREAAGEPLCLAAARALVEGGPRVGILTGACVPDFMPVGENDGPYGTVVLAAALARMGRAVTIVTDVEAAGPIQVLTERGGAACPIVTLGRGDLAQQEALADDLDVLVSIEKLGGNKEGKMHGITGVNRDHTRANPDRLVNRMNELGKTTIGIGDGGNEIGFGKFYDRLKEVHPSGEGVLCVVETTHTVVGTTSNWGAYGVTAALALLNEDPAMAHTPEKEEALIHMGVALNLKDGASGRAIPALDGIPAEVSIAAVRIVRDIVELRFQEFGDRGF